MFKLLRLPFGLLKLAVFAVAVVVVWMMLPTWREQLDVSTVVQAVLSGFEWVVEQVEKLHSGREEL